MGEYIISNGELYHYGIKGMKWGIRRYQNPDGTLTPEGRKRARQEYREDNKDAYLLGRDATILGRASSKANRKALRATARYDKNPSVRREKKAMVADKISKNLEEKAKAAVQKAKDHEKILMEKYGKEAIKNIKYDRKGRVKENVNTAADWGIATGLSMVTFGLATMGALPVAVFVTPLSAGDYGRIEYAHEKRNVKKELRKSSYSKFAG